MQLDSFQSDRPFITLHARRDAEIELLDRLVVRGKADFEDELRGPAIRAFWPRRGWSVSHRPGAVSEVCAAYVSDTAIGYAKVFEVADVRFGAESVVSATGLCMTYCVAPVYTGRGLATLLAAEACRKAVAQISAGACVFMQARAQNAASLMVGRNLGLLLDDRAPAETVQWADEAGHAQDSRYVTLLSTAADCADRLPLLLPTMRSRVDRRIGTVDGIAWDAGLRATLRSAA